MNCRFEAIRANRSHAMKIGLLLRIDLRESIGANCPDSRCKSPGHLSNSLSQQDLSPAPYSPSLLFGGGQTHNY